MNNGRIDIHGFLSKIMEATRKNAEDISNANGSVINMLNEVDAYLETQKDKFEGVNDQFFKNELGECHSLFLSELNFFNTVKIEDKMKVGNTILGSFSNLGIPKWLKQLISIIIEIVTIVLLFL